MSKSADPKPLADDRHAKRKVPVQRRSLATVGCIKQAALLLMKAEGLSNLSTDRIAEKAGVSIGSLYQYFPSREAILVAIYEDVSIEYSATLKSHIPKLLDMPTAEAVSSTVNMLALMHESQCNVLLQLTREMPQLRLAEHPFSFNRLVHSSTRVYLAHRFTALKSRDIERKAFFLEQIILGCISAFVGEAHPAITRKEFTRDLSQIITGYLENWQAQSA